MSTPLVVTPIGVVRTPFHEKAAAPRQPTVERDAPGTIELFAGRDLEDAVADLASWAHVWVLFWFDRAEGWRPKVQPPRSTQKRGVLATRSPHRPNPIGLSVVRLEAVEGLTLRVRGVDMLDGTPVLDIKPYVPYADIVLDAGSGWLDPKDFGDPLANYVIAWTPLAQQQAAWITRATGLPLASRVDSTLALGPTPHAYRRIRQTADGSMLAVKDWRIAFAATGRTITILRIKSGYRPRELATSDTPIVALHRQFQTVEWGVDNPLPPTSVAVDNPLPPTLTVPAREGS
ncbi:MAG: tRNA (N6-threonylcarbamoyladenosine(37)-N6)-methyltransferase TrmO [Myxococcales bacterium]|nr:tRNA (N6-threonylcarbamoyladenosine(37)-N6)-methyltransferase TrmO [Myxococcales bacterium]